MINFSRSSVCFKLNNKQVDWLSKQPAHYLMEKRLALVLGNDAVINPIEGGEEDFIVLFSHDNKRALAIPNKGHRYVYDELSGTFKFNQEDSDILEFFTSR